MSEDQAKPKRRKTECEFCIICRKQSPLNELTSPRDNESWKTLCEAAAVRHFQPIIKLAQDNPTATPDIKYHRECRSEFTHKKSLAILVKQQSSATSQNVVDPRHSSRQGITAQSRVYDKTCIFCQRQSKYIKGTNTREPLNPAVEMRADKTIRDIATQNLDEKILAVTSRDIVAAEAHYHKSCYKDYTRKKPEKAKCENVDDTYQKAEKDALNMIYEYIRMDVFSNPRIVPMTELTTQLLSCMKTNGIDKVSEATKNHLHRNLAVEFGDSLHFFTVERRVYVRPDNLSIESISTNYVLLKKELDSYIKQQNWESMMIQVALLLREHIKGGIKEQSWPPHPEMLNSTYMSLPDSLLQFLKVLLGGEQISTTRINRLSWSIAQDIINGVTFGKVITPKHVLVPWVIKTLTGNVELIKTMNRLGHSCSYSTLEEIDTALCIEKLNNVESDSVPLPAKIHPCVPTVLAYDNIDRQEEVLSGAGTSHRVNGIIVQPTSLSCTPPKPKSTLKKDKKRTIQVSEQHLAEYITGKRVGPPPITPDDLSLVLAPSSLNALQRNLLWVLVRQHDVTKQKISSWTGYNIITRDDIEVSADTVGYLPTINAPATAMSTVQEILHQSVNIQLSLHLQNIAVVFDQALFAKATEIAWKHPDKFGSIVLMMGNFHTICNLLSIIGKMFGDAGLRDLAVESGAIAEGSINKVLEGNQYNRAVRFHKLTYEALMRLAYSGFVDWLHINHFEDIPNINDILPAVYDLHQNTCAATCDAALMDDTCQRILDLFLSFLKELRHKRGPLSAFWMTYVEIVEILLGLLRADREGDWYLHLFCIRNMIPWCFAMDKTNYSRYLPIYYAQMTQLKETCPDLHDHFENGGFSVQLRHANPFGRIAVDQTTEETVNKDTQTAGGTRGFSLKPGTVSRYYLTAEHRAAALRQLREQISVQFSGLSHADLEKTRIARDESDVASLVDLLENNWTNPFSQDSSDLVNISTGVAAPPDVSLDMLTAQEKGEAAYQNFQEHRLQKGEGFYDRIKKLQLKTFSTMKKKTFKGTNKEIILKADRRVFGNMMLIAQNRKLDMREVLCYPLGPLPWALANADGTMKKTNKAVLAKQLENKVSPAEDNHHPSATLIDAMGLIQKLHGENHTFEELSDHVLAQMLHAGHGSHRIDVIFDVYRDQSIKSAERVSRGSNEGITFSHIRPGHKIKNWRRLLVCTESKNKLTHFLADSWKDQSRRDKLGTKTMFVTYGDQCIKLTQETHEEFNALNSNQEEADTRLLLHAKHAATHYPSLVCITDDTDVFIICLALSNDISSRMFIRRGTKARTRLVDVTKLAAALGSEVCSALLGLHPWTGCDTISALAGQGKLKTLKIILQNQKFREAFVQLGTSWELSRKVFNIIQEFTCRLYCRQTKVGKVNELRYQMFCCKKGDLESGQLPPCEDALFQHTIRANYQAAIWRRSLENYPEIPDPTEGHGWIRNEEGNLIIHWMTTSPAPEVVLGLMSCKCTRACRPSDCTCMLNGLKCTAACKLLTCSNMDNNDEDDEEPQQDAEDLSDSDDD